jgi:hypothetical protein
MPSLGKFTRSGAIAFLSLTIASGAGCGGDDDEPGGDIAPGQPGAACSDSDDCTCIVCECDGEPGEIGQSCTSNKCDAPLEACAFPCSFTGAMVTGARVGTAAECE